MIVVADTSPLNYLIQLQLANILQRLYGTVVLPAEVVVEMEDPKAPKAVRQWISNLPDWMEVRNPTLPIVSELDSLGAGEKAAITLALELHANLLLIDERKAKYIAQTKFGFAVSGTLGILRDAHLASWIDGRQAFDDLCSQTTFRYTGGLRSAYLASLKR